MKSLRFGVFEFNTETRELRREGNLVRLQAQPAQVLAALLQEPGEIVSRDALRQAVWGDGTFVDFESGLNFCVAQIRTALGDSADSPRYIKTLPRRGYQFIAPVSSSAGLPAPVRTSRLLPLVLIIAVVALGILCWYLIVNLQPQPIRIAVTRFDNQTGNPDLDRYADVLADNFVAELTGSRGRFDVIGNAAVLRQPRDRRDLSEITSQLKAQYVVMGQLQRAGERGRVLIHLIRRPDQAHLKVTRVENVDLSESAKAPREIAARAAREFEERLRRPQAGR